jgi:hypothetical protein
MCCGRSAPSQSAVPRTSGDFAAVATGPDRFKVVSKTETDPETGKGVILSTHPDYRLAEIARKESGGVVRVIDS